MRSRPRQLNPYAVLRFTLKAQINRPPRHAVAPLRAFQKRPTSSSSTSSAAAAPEAAPASSASAARTLLRTAAALSVSPLPSRNPPLDASASTTSSIPTQMLPPSFTPDQFKLLPPFRHAPRTQPNLSFPPAPSQLIAASALTGVHMLAFGLLVK